MHSSRAFLTRDGHRLIGTRLPSLVSILPQVEIALIVFGGARGARRADDAAWSQVLTFDDWLRRMLLVDERGLVDRASIPNDVSAYEPGCLRIATDATTGAPVQIPWQYPGYLSISS